MKPIHPFLGYFGDFGGILGLDSVPPVGQQTTFTFQKAGIFGSIFLFDSDAAILSALRERMGNYGNIISASRPFFSDRWTIVVIPTASVTVSQWLDAFDSSWKDMGYEVSFIQAETGGISTQPGGVAQIIPSITETAGEAAAAAVKPLIEAAKPLLPYIVIGGIAFLLITMGPSLLAIKGRKEK